MRSFLFKVVLFLIVLSLLVFSVEFFEKPATSDYIAGIIDKHKRIDSLKVPRIIFGGGSNLAFGIDSKEIEDSLRMPVVNLGLHGGLGLKFMLNELRYSIKENDVVFLSIEYFLRDVVVYGLDKKAGEFYPPARQFYTVNYQSEFDYYRENNRKKFKKLFERKKGEENEEIYTRNAFNKYGDVIAHLDKPQPEKLRDRTTFTYHYWDGIAELNQFYELAKSKHVSVFFLFPNFPASEYETNKEAISLTAADIQRDLKIPILNTPTDFVYPDSLFFDTVYHLNKKGRKERTEKLIGLIKANPSAVKSIGSGLASAGNPAKGSS